MISDRDLTRDDLPFPIDRPMSGQDLLQLFPSLLRPMWSAAANAVRCDVGTVAAVAAHRVTLNDGNGGTYSARYMKAYAPTVGDAVLVVRNAAQAIVLGPLA